MKLQLGIYRSQILPKIQQNQVSDLILQEITTKDKDLDKQIVNFGTVY